jgi:outer membrane protein OmpA-like peptidoglycan-associated protein
MRTDFVPRKEDRKGGREASDVSKPKKQSSKAETGGSSAMPIFLQRMRVSPKLKSGQASSGHEQEADRVASAVQSSDTSSESRPLLHATESAGAAERDSPSGRIMEQKIQETQGSGSQIPSAVRESLEEKLGADFSSVRVHTDAKANRLSNALGANAFTTGNDIYFNQGRYDPESKSGQGLLAHELTHVVQQGGKDSGAIQCDMMESLAPTALGGFEIGMATHNAPAAPGMEGTIVFHPDPTGPYSTEITLIQTANVVDVAGTTTPSSGAPVDWTNVGTGGEAPRNETRTPLGGTFVDALYANTLQGSAVTPDYVQAADIAARPAQNYHGWLRSQSDVREASLYDYPNTSFDSDFKFETVAKGSDNQVVYGSLEWGFKIRSGIVSDEFRRPHALESTEFDESLERFRGYYTHEPIVLYFDTDHDLPIPGELTKLSDVTSYMTRYPDVLLQVEGYADETGPASHNRDLSLRRADNVVTILTGIGVDPARIDSVTVGHGETTAFSAGSPAAAAGSLRANRRAVITFVRRASTPIVP